MPITKTINNYEKSLNSDGHQFHQNQLNEQSPFVSPEHKKITAYDVGNPVTNAITWYIDGTAVYGSSDTELAALRTTGGNSYLFCIT
jgi:hypothetical protein